MGEAKDVGEVLRIRLASKPVLEVGSAVVPSFKSCIGSQFMPRRTLFRRNKEIVIFASLT